MNWDTLHVGFSDLSQPYHHASPLILFPFVRPGLPKGSFRFHITMDTLSFSYVLNVWSYSGLTLVRVRPCRANKNTYTPLCTSVLLLTQPLFMLSTNCSPNSEKITKKQSEPNILLLNLLVFST